MSDAIALNAAPEKQFSRVRGRYYALILLTAVYGLNFLDRTIFNVLIEPIKKQFGLSDTLIGLLAGFGFVLMYSLAGMPIARIADRSNRRNIVALALAFWSAMTALCGLAQNVGTLAMARVGVGLGESASTPASQSLIADLFPKNERPRALGIYAAGIYIGIFLGFFIGGWVNQIYGWRIAFLSVGVPGIALALLLSATVREPERGGTDPRVPKAAPARLGPTLSFLMGQKSYVFVVIGFCLTSYANYAASVWIPSFMARVHHLSSGEIGTYAGTLRGLCGMAGTLFGGFAIAYVSRRDDRWKLWAPAIMTALGGPVFAVSMLTGNFDLFIVTLGLFSFLTGFHLGPIFAIAQTVAKPDMRAFASATNLLTATCFGQGLGPLVIGLVNDALKPAYGVDAIRYSMLAVAATAMLGGLFFVLAARTVRADIAKASA